MKFDRRSSLAILAASVLSACASNPPAPSQVQIQPTDPAIIARVKAERDTATDEYVKCLFRAAKTLDDGMSDPATIGQAMLTACTAEFNHQVMAYWVAGTSLDQIDTAMRKDRLGLAIQIVLKNRKAAL
jgi:hypothetical protein